MATLFHGWIWNSLILIIKGMVSSFMIKIHRIICTCFGIGYIGKGSGTIAAIVCCMACYLLGGLTHYGLLLPIFTLIIMALGVWSGSKVEACWGKDSNKVVIDEVAGMCVSLLWIPALLKYVLVALLLFRFFDIVKPLFISRLERLPGGWGVMADDLLAGIYANIILELMIQNKLF